MSIWNKVFLGLSIVLSLAYFILAARALGARNYWGESAKLHEDALAAVAKDKQLLVDGKPGEAKPGYQEGLRRLKEDVHRMVIARGRVWRYSMPGRVDATGQVVVTTSLPGPHKDARQASVFVFADPTAQTPAAYLGEFSVVGMDSQKGMVNGQAVEFSRWQLQPVRPMSDGERQRLQQSVQNKATWSLYELMPGDPVDVPPEGAAAAKAEQAAGGAEAPKPEDAVKAPKVGSPEWLEAQVDYRVLFSEFYRQRALLNDLLQTTGNDAQAVENADASARQQVELLQKEIASTKEELKAMQAERDLVAKHRAALADKLAQVQDAIKKTDEANRAIASEIARLQLEAKRRIDERTSKIARAPAAR
jgi:hypothetical protein